jgi:L-seryl-tRNA(Ser) seleniumtransferase
MLLLRDHGIVTVHFAGMPPGTSALLLKFLAPETVARFGGSHRLAAAFDDSLTELARLVPDPEAIRSLLLGAGST